MSDNETQSVKAEDVQNVVPVINIKVRFPVACAAASSDALYCYVSVIIIFEPCSILPCLRRGLDQICATSNAYFRLIANQVLSSTGEEVYFRVKETIRLALVKAAYSKKVAKPVEDIRYVLPLSSCDRQRSALFPFMAGSARRAEYTSAPHVGNSAS